MQLKVWFFVLRCAFPSSCFFFFFYFFNFTIYYFFFKLHCVSDFFFPSHLSEIIDVLNATIDALGSGDNFLMMRIWIALCG